MDAEKLSGGLTGERVEAGTYQWTKLEVENAALFIELAALRWKPITPENMPTMDDDVGGWLTRMFDAPPVWTTLRVLSFMLNWTYERYIGAGWTHIRAVNAPQKDVTDGTESKSTI